MKSKENLSIAEIEDFLGNTLFAVLLAIQQHVLGKWNANVTGLGKGGHKRQEKVSWSTDNVLEIEELRSVFFNL